MQPIFIVFGNNNFQFFIHDYIIRKIRLLTTVFVWVNLPISFFFRTMKVRKVEKVVLSVEQSEGVGARVRRSIGRREVSSSRA